MGRLPKGFKKTLAHHEDGPPPAAPAQPAAAPPGMPNSKAGPKEKDSELNSSFLKEVAPTPAAAPPADKHVKPQPAADNDSDSDEGASTSGPETKSQMFKRHKKEMQAFKKNLPRLGKKSKEEVAKLTSDLETKQAKELAALESSSQGAAGSGEGGGGSSSSAVEAAGEAVAALHVGGGKGEEEEDGGGAGGKGGHMTKAMKRRQKLAEAEAEREARIAAEAAAAGPSARQEEEEALLALLQPLGLRMRDIRADGHCLYRSLEDQLVLVGGTGSTGPKEYQQLRTAAAAHMRQHPEQYMSFMDVEDKETPEQALEQYCRELEGTAAWGGQLELSVLAQVLQRPISVYSVGMSAITLGEEHASEDNKPLKVCYLRHAFGLGEHYNSLEAE